MHICTKHYHRHLCQRLCGFARHLSLSVSHCHSNDFISVPRKIFVPCRRAFYLCVLVRPFALLSIFKFFFSRVFIFLWSGDNIRHHMYRSIGKGIYFGSLGFVANGEILQERNFPKCIIVIKSNVLLPTNYDRLDGVTCDAASFFLAYVNYGWSWIFFCFGLASLVSIFISVEL